MKHRPAPERGFPRAEYEQRLQRAQRLMARDGIGALWFSTKPEIRYFSGFTTPLWQSPTRTWFLVVPAAGKPVAIIPEIGARVMARTWIDEIRTWSAPAPGGRGISLLADALSEAAGETGRCATPMGPESHLHLPLRDADAVRAALSGRALEMVDATPLVRALRLIKSNLEIEKIAHICAIASDAFAALPGALHANPERTEREIFRDFKIELLRRGADDVPYLTGGAGPGGYADIISPPGDRSPAAGDVLIMDTGAVFDGYFCDFNRNFAMGNASNQVRRAYRHLIRAVDAGLDAARPGVTAAVLYDEMRRKLDSWPAAEHTVGRMGHGLGIQLTEPPSLAPFDQTVLEEGVVLTLEPGVALEAGRTLVTEEVLVIRANGAELLTARAPEELPVVDCAAQSDDSSFR